MPHAKSTKQIDKSGNRFPDFRHSALSLRWRKVRILVKRLFRPTLIRQIAALVTDGYLARTGWVESILKKDRVDFSREQQPWLTYPFISFIEPRLRPDMTLFEYGAGASTLYFATRVGTLISVEHDRGYFQALTLRIPPNVQLVFERHDSDRYVDSIAQSGRLFDLILVDGRNRVRCVEASLAHLKPSGVLILDDAERPEYGDAIRILGERHFRRLDFWGLAPGITFDKCTSLFYRTTNCLDI